MTAAVNVILVPGQDAVAGDAETTTFVGLVALTVITTGALLTVAGDAQPRLLVSMHKIVSELLGRYANVLPIAVCNTPLTFHLYTGAVPPFTLLAVYITNCPLHMIEGEDRLTETVGVTVALTASAAAADVAVSNAL